MKKGLTTNTFQDGLVMDFNPLVQPLNTLSNVLNGTLITMNGNENMLLNDMGNGRVESAYLPEGYVPVGTCELGGVVYIASYNPFTKKCQIGSFPSPERNVTSTEVSENTAVISENAFYSDISGSSSIPSILKTPYQRLVVYETNLNPGDKYLLCCENIIQAVLSSSDVEGAPVYNYISALGLSSYFKSLLLPRYLKLSVISIASNGSYTDLSDTCVWLKVSDTYKDSTGVKRAIANVNDGYYYIYTDSSLLDNLTQDLDIDEYRDLITSNYNVFASKYSGLLGVLASLECIDTFDVAWDAYKGADGGWNFYFFLNWTYDNELSPDKINLYGVHILGEVTPKEEEDTNNTDTDNTDTGDTVIPTKRKALLFRETITEEKTEEETALKEYLVIDNYPYLYPIDTAIEGPGIEGDPIPLADAAVAVPVEESAVTIGKTDIMLYLDYIEDDNYTITFLNPPYINSLYDAIQDSKEEGEEYSAEALTTYIQTLYKNADPLDMRKNKGKDNLLLLSTPYTIYDEEGILDLTITPTMPFGEMAWLKQQFSIDLSKLGSGIIDLCRYRYYVDNETITLSWGLNAYPEINKKIEEVTFTFYPIDNNVTSWLGTVNLAETESTDTPKMFALYIDGYKGLNGYWVAPESKTPDTSGVIPYYTPYENTEDDLFSFTESNRTSFNGYFTLTITFSDVDRGTTYMVKISIDYDGNSIDYYRIFFTEPIFNNAYYTTSDFATLKLSDYTDFSFTLNNAKEKDVKNEYNQYKVLNNDPLHWEEEEIDLIPSFYQESPSDDKQVEYCINNDYNVSLFTALVHSDIVSKKNVKYDSFLVDVSLGEEQQLDAELSIDENPSHTSSGVSGLTVYDQEIDDVWYKLGEPSFSALGDMITGKFSILTHCPVVVSYNNWTAIAVPYQFTPLEVSTCFIIGSGSNNTVNLSYSTIATTNVNFAWESTKATGKQYEFELYEISGIYANIKDSLNLNDVVCIGVMMKAKDKDHVPGKTHNLGVIWGTGDVVKNPHGIDMQGGKALEVMNYWNSDRLGEYSLMNSEINEGPYGSFLMLYAMKDTSDNVTFFTYGPRIKVDSNNSKYTTTYTWYTDGTVSYNTAVLQVSDSTITLYGADFTHYSLAFHYSTGVNSGYIRSEIAERPFSGFYKMKDYGGTFDVYGYDRIFYYDRFALDYIVTLSANNPTLDVFINNTISITNSTSSEINDRVYPYINNLSLSYPEEIEIHYTGTKAVDFRTIISDFLTLSDRNFIAYEDELGNINIYQGEFNAAYMYRNTGDSWEAFSTIGKAGDGWLPIVVRNGLTRLSGSIYLINSIAFLCEYEELAVIIRNIAFLYPYW